ncbi:Glycosyl hydrolase family 25 [Apilactobacillus kunkeei]|uniref:GH25 family lysozyme n=1 Tax=Apilactobacillus TaxID=2767877 RepID=UPI0006B23B44|nr:GH25 family lysozyme [Apilactobacillus kunkeei]KOY71831.1 Glycosyl hydrolase family 25 [Apilactobacillus kunkeei]KOY77549.1 Glycosyl hydrolase family 25 [Apilactobacillus kunkeei]
MIKFRFKSILMTMVASLALTTGVGAIGSFNTHANASSKTVYDLSEWQGRLTNKKAKNLSKEVPFAILRVQYGSSYSDKTFKHNKALLDKYQVPYGVYSFSRYNSSAAAAREARDLYNRAPNAKFYVNDFESASISRRHSNDATAKWVDTLRPLVGSRKILFYSYLSFMKTYASQALSKYDGYWLASYTKNEPSIAHVLWQYTDRHYSSALHKKVDASKLREQKSWFLGTVAKTVNNNDANKGQKVANKQGNTEVKPAAASSAKTAKVVKLAAKKAKAKKATVKKTTAKKHVKKAKKHVKKVTHHKKKHVKKSVKKHHKKKHVKKVHHKKKHHKKHVA